MKIWQKNQPRQGREDILKKVEAFTVGDDYRLDQHLVPYDVKASKVHARFLEHAGWLTASESRALHEGLEEIQQLWEENRFDISREQEDGHTAIETYLTEKLGETGKKIHTGRSRNDQVLTALRLYELDRLSQTETAVNELVQPLLNFARVHQGVPMPGYTHTRKAMLSGVSQWAAGYAELLLVQRDSAGGLRSLLSRSPLGTAAGFGSSLELDRDGQARALGFETPLISATSAQLSRGWMELQLVQHLSGYTALLARLAADIIRYSGTHYGYFRLDPGVCTGSSIMPQKQNPDLAELIRARHSVMLAQAAQLQSLTQNLESGYHRDLQLTKGPVITAFGTLLETLAAAELLIRHTEIDPEQLEAACTPEIFAAEYANLLVKKEGISFREAYKKAGDAILPGGGTTDRALQPAAMMRACRQLGAPGNPGLERLQKWLVRT